MKYRIIMLFLLPFVSSGCHHQYNLNNTPADSNIIRGKGNI